MGKKSKKKPKLTKEVALVTRYNPPPCMRKRVTLKESLKDEGNRMLGVRVLPRGVLKPWHHTRPIWGPDCTGCNVNAREHTRGKAVHCSNCHEQFDGITSWVHHQVYHGEKKHIYCGAKQARDFRTGKKLLRLDGKLWRLR